MRHLVLLGPAQESDQRRGAGRPGAQIEGLHVPRRRARVSSSRASTLARGDLAEVDEEDRVLRACTPTARSTRGRRARPGAGAPRAPRGPVMRARSASPWWVTFTRSVSANEPFRCWWESPARLAAPWRGWSTRAPYVPIGALDRPSGESTDRFAADVAGCAAREQADGRGERALPLYRSTAHRSADEVEVAAFNAEPFAPPLLRGAAMGHGRSAGSREPAGGGRDWV